MHFSLSLVIFPFLLLPLFPSPGRTEPGLWEVEQEANSCPTDRHSQFSSPPARAHTRRSLPRIHTQLPALHRLMLWGGEENIASGSASRQGRGGRNPCFPWGQSRVFPGEKAVFSPGAAGEFCSTQQSLRGSRCRTWGLLCQEK